jgi:hypothetical protein
MRHNPAIIWTLAAALLMFPRTSWAQVVSDKTRASKLEEVARVVDAPATDLDAIFKDFRDPFYAVAQPRRVQPSQPGAGPSAAGQGAVSAEQTDSHAILLAVAAQLHPTGIMTGVSRRYIVSGDGSIYEVGKSFKIEIDKQVVEVFVDEAGDQSYVLRYGKEKLRTSYDDDHEAEGSATNSTK